MGVEDWGIDEVGGRDCADVHFSPWADQDICARVSVS